MDQSKFTVIIPSKVVDDNLLNCEKKIRQFYKKIKVLLMIDGKSNNLNLSNCTEIIPTGLVNVAEKRNIKIGKRNFGKVSVVSGLSKGNVVISEGVSKVRNKSKVKIINP